MANQPAGPPRRPVKPTHKAVKAYYDTLAKLGHHKVKHEGALRSAFQTLLADTAKTVGWTLVPEQSMKVGGKTVIPDATLRDDYLPRGFWEAKDTSDDLDAEIRKKIDKGYPLGNTIFEDTRRAVLFQGSQKVLDADLTNHQSIADLLNAFYSYAEPDIENFEQAVDEFKQRVPELAQGLAAKIAQAHKDNKRFIDAFDGFFTLCRTSLNPNLSPAAVDEMLIQHLLTERLIRNIFENQDFTQRNVIAAEVEKVIGALVSKSFNRHEFLKSLDRFYVAIENATKGIDDFGEKQHFLNTIYERFFQGYSVKVADTHGIVYTPQAIVDFMCASVVEVLEKEFGKTLGDKDVHIIDPCTGTGNFIVNLLRRVPKKDLPRMYREQMFANEVMLMPYYIAALNIEHAYYELTGQYEPFEGLCFVDTLDMAEHPQGQFGFMTEKNTARVERQKKAPITVVIGNPPYNLRQQNENDNNRNRSYEVIDQRIRETYSRDSDATSKIALSDSYVKFFRWATDRLGSRDGIVCFVSNNSFVDQSAFDGMRFHLNRDFTTVFHVDLQGNVRHNPKLSGTKYNVFGIQVGVGITVATRVARHRRRRVLYRAVEVSATREEKLRWLSSHAGINGVQWQDLTPDKHATWLIPEHAGAFASFVPLASPDIKESVQERDGAVFKAYTRGLETSRDWWVYDFCRERLESRVRSFIDHYNAEVDRWRRSGRPRDIDNFVNNDEARVKWSSRLKETLQREVYAEYGAGKMRGAVYRPFTRKDAFFDSVLNHRRGMWPAVLPKADSENSMFCATGVGAERPFATFAVCVTPDLNFFGPGTVPQWYPFYVYDEDGSNRRENITDWALNLFRDHYGDATIGKWDIFYYVYGMLHHPGYRAKFAENLKRELPRIPLAGGAEPPCPHGGHMSGDVDRGEDTAARLDRTGNRGGRRGATRSDTRSGRDTEPPCPHGGQMSGDVDRGGDTAARCDRTDRRGATRSRTRSGRNTEPPCPHGGLNPDGSNPSSSGKNRAVDFWSFANAGRELADWHLNYDRVNDRTEDSAARRKARRTTEPTCPHVGHVPGNGDRGADTAARPGDAYPLKWVETPGVPLSYRVEKMKLTKDKTAVIVNDSLRLEGIPPEVFEYRLGNRSALDWVIDQYQVSTDKRSGITSDPNRPDDEQYIVRLVCQVVRVSVETVKIVKSLPKDYGVGLK